MLMSRTIVNAHEALVLTESRKVFARERKSLPNKLNSPKPIFL